MITLKVTEHGLLISIDESNEDARQEIEAIDERHQDDKSRWFDLLDSSRYIGDDWHLIDPSLIGSLTNAPMIGQGAHYTEGEDLPTYYDHIFYFGNYQTHDPIYLLLTYGSVLFTELK